MLDVTLAENQTIILQEPNSSVIGDTSVLNSGGNSGLAEDIVIKSSGIYLGYMMFDLKNLTEKGVIRSKLNNATIHVYVFDTEASNLDMKVHHVYNHTWNETNITFTDQPCGSFNGDFQVTPSDSNLCNVTNSSEIRNVNSGQYYVFNFLPAIKKEMSENNSNVSALFSRIDTGSSPKIRWYSKESGDTTNNLTTLPYLNITYAENIIPNVSNLSLTPLPISIGDEIKGHALFNDSDNDDSGGNETYWWINKTLITEANNTFILKGGNTTFNSNITFSVRFNDTYNWSDWTNSTTATVGDSTAPTITNKSLQGKTSFTTNDKVNITSVVEDAVGEVQSVIVTTNKSDVHTNHTMIELNKVNGAIYQFADTFGVGDYNIPYFYAKDGSDNERQENSNLSFSVTTPTTAPAVTTGGGGGVFLLPKKEIEFVLLTSLGGKSYKILGSSGGIEEKPIHIFNTGNDTIEVKLTCEEDLSSPRQVCQFIQIDTSSVKIIPSDEPTVVWFNITVPEDVRLGEIVKFNILGTAPQKKDSRLFVSINIFPGVKNIFGKLFGFSMVSFKKLKPDARDLPIPNFLVFFLIPVVMFLYILSFFPAGKTRMFIGIGVVPLILFFGIIMSNLVCEVGFITCTL
tara:strand:+ start:257 stop:2143 length:1887 start_codon:yes stop_codon:yes gene_type:complete